MRIPYIGITDFETADQCKDMLDYFESHRRKDSKRKLMIGIMMSYKTLNRIPTKWAKVFPDPHKISDIFIPHKSAFNTLHYADYTGTNILSNLIAATEYSGPYMHALQLDMIWPSIDSIQNYHSLYPHVDIILQINSNSLDLVDNDPFKLIKKLSGYVRYIKYILLDKSMGTGKGMDAKALLPFAKIVQRKLPCLGIAAAGGLGPSTMDLAKPLITEFPMLSIDAQGKLRPSGSALDPIDWEYAKKYVKKALNILKY